MKIEAATLIFIAICVFLSFYLAFLSFQTIDDTLRKQLVMFAVSFLMTGIVVLMALAVHLGVKKALSRTEDMLRSEKSLLEEEND